MPTVEQALADPSKEESLSRQYMEALRGLHVASQLSATALGAEMDPVIDGIRGQLAYIRQQMLDAGMSIPMELELRGLGRG